MQHDNTMTNKSTLNSNQTRAIHQRENFIYVSENYCVMSVNYTLNNVWDAQTFQSSINIKISQFANYPCLN